MATRKRTTKAAKRTRKPAKKNPLLTIRKLKECETNRLTGKEKCRDVNPCGTKRKRNTTIIKAKKIGRVIIRKRPSVANPYAYQIQYQRPGEPVQYAGAYYTSSRADALKQAEMDLKRRKLWQPKTKLITAAVPLTSVAARHKNSSLKRGKKNPQYSVSGKPKWTDSVREKVSALTRGAAIRKVQRTAKGPKTAYKWWVAKNPASLNKKQSSKASRTTRTIREKFTGLKSRKTAVMNAPKGTPANLAKLGKLISIKAARGTIRPGRRNPSSTVWLCADTRGKLHLCTTGDRLIDGPAQSFGEIREIEYEAIKPHLGHARPTIFFHQMAEEGGKRPELRADGAGGLKITGGSYYITPEGIRD